MFVNNDTPTQSSDFIKQREICFTKLPPDPKMTESAATLLDKIEGVLEVSTLSESCISVEYDLVHVTLEYLEDHLSAYGFHLENSLINRLRRGLYYYTEEVQRSNAGINDDRNPQSTLKVFTHNYQRRRRGCRDIRPEHWRKYL